ncbi:MAG: HsdR family type I site-specific deoxyribonuclease [Methyloprofundus sp.]|nr:HsdR family type I site-specific deoxyribonuclease [Methyloprofundus sp.]
MGNIGKKERITQNRIVQLFSRQLGYTYLGNLEHKSDNSNIEAALLRQYLRDKYSPEEINKALDILLPAANNVTQDLMHNNQRFYSLLRYGVDVKAQVSTSTETVHLINWHDAEANNFYTAEEVTLFGEQEKRPDIVLYINGIAIGVLELKNSRKDLAEGIRQNITNQQSKFISSFFNTIQLVFAGNDSQGLRYGTVGTAEKFFLAWKEDEQDDSTYKLDKYLVKMCHKQRLIELMYDFVLFDGGVKKLPRVHQYFGIKAAQEHIRRRKGGIIWHTQGSGKSIMMVLLAKWLLENNAQARVVIVTDRDELDKQIERVFNEAGEPICRTSSGRDLMAQLGQKTPRLLCSLVHKFAKKDVGDFETFIKDLESQPSHAVGEIFVFVDECHRTQSGKLHRTMKAMMPSALLIGFTGTPLLKADKKTSLEIFGQYIHTYKFNEAVDDGVVLDLVYEARDIDQRLSSQKKVDEWFDAATEALNDFQKAALKKKWGTMQQVLSSKSRMSKIVVDIIHDFKKKPRLSSEAGNAILVASSIYEACRYYELFQATPLKGKCAVVTSYNPLNKDIATEDTGANTETDKETIYAIYTELLKNVIAKPKKSKTETYEDNAKAVFIKEPANMKLLIVVDKLLTGFDAPSCSVLYIDKSMQNHGLFQAICRVNRLDSEDKTFGEIVDYKGLFQKVEDAVSVYTSELEYDEFEPEDCDVLLKERLQSGREQLESALETLEQLCEPVKTPKGDLEHIHYFCGNTEKPEDLKERELQRHTLYKKTVVFARAYAHIKEELEAAGYDAAEQARINERMDHFLKLRDIIRRASGEVIDLKAYEAEMRYLIDHYIQADDSQVVSTLDDLPLVELIVNKGIATVIDDFPEGIKGSEEAVSETIANNVRSTIIKKNALNPAYFKEMSTLLDAIIKQRKKQAISYAEYLQQIAELAQKVATGEINDTPSSLNTAAKRALYHNLGKDESLAIQVDTAVMVSKPANWRGHQAREDIIKGAIYKVLNNVDEVDRIFRIMEQQAEY